MLRAGKPVTAPSQLVDTSVLVEHLKGRPAALALVGSVFRSRRHAFISVISRAEILAGAKSEEEPAIEAFLDLFSPLNVDVDAAQTAGELARTHRRSHPELTIADYIVAAQAMKGDFDLLTATPERYPSIKGLMSVL